MEYDTDQLSSSDVSQERISSHHQSLETESRGHTIASSYVLQKSLPNIRRKRSSVRLQPAAMSYHEGGVVEHRRNYEDQNWASEEQFQRSPKSFEVSLIDGHHTRFRTAPTLPLEMSDEGSSELPISTQDGAPSPTPFATPADILPLLAGSNVSVEQEIGNHSSSLFASNINRNIDPEPTPFGEQGMDSPISDASSAHSINGHSIVNSKCVPVEGRLADLSDNDSYSKEDGSDDEEGGIVILDESTEEEYEESMRESLENNLARHQQQSSSLQHEHAPDTQFIETQIETTEASMYLNDPIVLAAAARVNANPIPVMDVNQSLNFEQLLQEAGDHSESDTNDNAGDDPKSEDRDDASNAVGAHFWQRNPLSVLNRRAKTTSQTRSLVTPPSTRAPVRATRVRHDKFVVEMDIVPSDVTNQRLDVRDVIDIMANIELLHLWFDPVPAVFDATVKDSSGSSMVSPRSSPSNSLEGDRSNNRQYDGQWVEISTPPLTVPSDSRIYGCLRAIRVSFRSLIGFPARIRSMIFVERSCCRIGMTLGPYPDGFMCFQNGTMAYHTFKVVRRSDEESGTANNAQAVVVTDEVRLRRGREEDFNGTSRGYCSIFRFLLGLFEWALLFRWYQPDLASYMQQTISSMDKLRTLVQRGESGAYAGEEMIMDGSDWEGDDGKHKGTMDTPLLS